jgi:uncharacterized protein YkwD
VSVIFVIAVVWLLLLVLALALLRAAAIGDRADARHAHTERSRRRRASARRAGRRRGTRTAFLAALALTAGAAGLAATARDARAQACAGSGAGATVCLINAERRARGLSPLGVNARLARAATRHARDMVARSYFSHLSPGGVSLADRLRRVGYARRSCSWSGGETLAWGSGILQSPASRVRAWMDSPPHRAILLGAGFRQVGIGIAAGSPSNASVGSTYVGEFGRRRC